MKGKTKESLANSKKIKANFLFRLGLDKVPHSVLQHNRHNRALDVLAETRSYKSCNVKAIEKTEKRHFREAFAISGKSVRGGKTMALSRFSQNIGQLYVKFFCPENGIVYDPFAGHNSRMELTYISRRNYIGVDVSHEFMQANYKIQKILEKREAQSFFNNKNTIQLIEHSSDKIDLDDEIADFTITSPPYWDLEYYGDEPEQLGNAKSYRKFIHLLHNHVEENYRILKPGSYCAWCINDFTKDKIFYPYHVNIISLFKRVGFTIHDVNIVDLGRPFTESFIQSIIITKRFPKRHEYCIIGKKEGINQQVEEHIQNLIK